MKRFMILMRENDGAWSEVGADEQQRILARYFDWIDRLTRDGQYEGGEPLVPGGHVLRAVGGEVIDGPFTETKEVLTGLFIVRAETLEKAVELARSCPALAHGLAIEVRQIDEYARP